MFNNNKRDKMIKYIAAERDTPDVPRVWGEGKTDLIAKLQCEIALREKLIGKLERGCTEGVCSTHRYFIESETEYKKNNEQQSKDYKKLSTYNL